MRKTYLAKKVVSLVITTAVCIAGIHGGTMKTVKATDYKRDAAIKYVSFGSYWQEDTNGDGVANESDAKTPITWQVLWSSNTQAFLIAEKCIDARAFHDTNEKATWETCDLRKWLNGTFIKNAFNSEEQAAIVEKDIVTEGDSFMENKQDIITKDKVFLPSIAEMTNVSYGYSCVGTEMDYARKAMNTAYCAAKPQRYGVGESDTYWLRNSGQSNDEACTVTVNGVIDYLSNVDYQGHGIRPALYLNLGAENTGTDTDNQDKPVTPSQTAAPSPSPLATLSPSPTTAPLQPPIGDANAAVISNNLHENEYPYYAAQTVNSYLTSISEHLYERAEYTGDKIVIETYDKDTFRCQSGKELPMELPVFGGIYSGSKYNFVVYGQENLEENDSTEVIRICKYDKDWNRLGAGSIYGANTIRPFRAGSLRMCESGDMLYIRTSHQMYASAKDGKNHQANMTIALRQSDATVTDCSYQVTFYSGYASHSFNQFIKTDGNDIITVDHGDAYPRAFVLNRFPDVAGGENITIITGELELNTFTGSTGENYTGAELGGLEVSSSHYLAACNSVDQETDYNGRVRNVYLYTVDKSQFSSDSIKVKQITDYAASGTVSASVPSIIKLEQDKFALLWEEFTPYAFSAFYPQINCSKTLKYVLLDGQGNLQGNIKSVSGCLSDCVPVVENGVLTWYVTENSVPTFYQLNLEKEVTVAVNSPTASAAPIDSPAPSPDKNNIPENPGTTTAPEPTITPEPITTSEPTTEPTANPENSPSVAPPTTNEVELIQKPGKVTIKKLKKSGKGCAKVSWGKVKCNDGYQIQYSRNRSFSNKKQDSTYSQSIYIFGKSKKIYYVRVRAVNWGRTSQTNYGNKYGKWSNIKKIKLK